MGKGLKDAKASDICLADFTLGLGYVPLSHAIRTEALAGGTLRPLLTHIG